jgi:hypothetical protein
MFYFQFTRDSFVAALQSARRVWDETAKSRFDKRLRG